MPAVSGKSFIGDKMNITEDMLIAARDSVESLFALKNDELRLVLSEAYQLWYEDKWLGFRGYSGFHSLRCPLCGGRLFAGISELDCSEVIANKKPAKLLVCHSCINMLDNYTLPAEVVMNEIKFILKLTFDNDQKSEIELNLPFLHKAMLYALLNPKPETDTE